MIEEIRLPPPRFFSLRQRWSRRSISAAVMPK
jgi:hypothetical protein